MSPATAFHPLRRTGGYRRTAGLLAALLGCTVPAPVLALSFDFSDDLHLDLDTTLTYGAQWRVSNRDPKILEYDTSLATLLDPARRDRVANVINYDDGNRNFGKGLISNRVAAVIDMDLNAGDYGVFARARAYYDSVYRNDHTDLSAYGFRTYNNGTNNGGNTDRGDFPERTRDRHGAVAEFLDAFAYATFELPGDRLFELRAGRQVINWGESTFYQGVNGLQNRFDANAANTPGVEVKEILLPTGAIYGQVDVVEGLTFELYYQYEWLETELNGVGSYFSTEDFLGPGAKRFLIPYPVSPATPNGILALPRTADRQPGDSGQWGAAFHYVLPSGLDLGFYHVVGHNKAPSFRINYGAGGVIPESYTIRWFDEIRAWGMSFSTVIGETNVQGELSYTANTPIADAAGDPERNGVVRAALGGSHVFGPSFLADEVNLVFEAATVQVRDRGDRDLRYNDTAWSYAIRAELAYYNVAQGIDLKVPVFWQNNVNGTIREANMINNTQVVSIGIRGIYLNNLSATLAYTTYFGGGADNFLTDRDNIALTVKYGF